LTVGCTFKRRNFGEKKNFSGYGGFPKNPLKSAKISSHQFFPELLKLIPADLIFYVRTFFRRSKSQILTVLFLSVAKDLPHPK